MARKTKLNGNKLCKLLVNVGDLAFRRRVEEVINSLEIKNNDVVLDCGCGEGFYLMVLNELFPKIKLYGVDYDTEMISKAKEWLKGKKNINLFIEDINGDFLEGMTFDKIILSEVLEHLEDDFSLLLKLKSKLKPNGRLVITVPNHNYPFWWDPLNWVREKMGLGHFNKDNELLAGLWSMHLRLYYPNEILSLVEKAGFVVDKAKSLTRFCLPLTQVVLHLGKRFYTKLPVSKNIYNTMEKFKWQETKGSPNKNLLRWGLKLFELVDRLNDRFPPLLTDPGTAILVLCENPAKD